jgi:hypothetical protein
MTQSTFRWFLAVAALVAFAWIMLTMPARAEWPHNAFSCKSYRADLIWREWALENCPRYRRRHWRVRAQAHWKAPAYDGAVCHGSIIITGDQAHTTKDATANAVLAWQGRVRFRYGERYIDMGSAKDATVVCAQSSVPDAFRDKAGATLYRCELQARPCRATAKKMGVR